MHPAPSRITVSVVSLAFNSAGLHESRQRIIKVMRSMAEVQVWISLAASVVAK